MLCQPASWPAKCCTERCLELQNNATGHMTFVAVANMLAPTCDCCYTYVNLSGFLIICLDLVLMISLPCEIVLLTLEHLYFLVFAHCLPLYCFVLCLLPLLFDCELFADDIVHYDYYCCLYVHLTYAIGFLLTLFNNSASGSVLVGCSFVDWYCGYESPVIDVGFMYHLLWCDTSAIGCKMYCV